MKTLPIIILAAILTACGGGEVESIKVAPTEGVSCANVDKANAPAGWCANGSDTVHLGKPNS